MKTLMLFVALTLAAPAFAQSNPIGGAGGAGLTSGLGSTVTSGPPRSRPGTYVNGGWTGTPTWNSYATGHRDLRASKAFMWHGFAAPACCNAFSSPD